MRRCFAALICLMLASPAAAAAAERQMEDKSIAVLRTIDKVSARTNTFEVPVDKTVKFGDSLFIKVRACREAAPIDLPESAAFLQIWERPPQETDSRWVFSGWMFASNPALSAMDHPVYDVWVISCKNKSSSAKTESFSTEAEPAAATDTAPVPAAAAPLEDEEETLPED